MVQTLRVCYINLVFKVCNNKKTIIRCRINGKIIKEMSGSVASGTHCITVVESVYCAVRTDCLYTADYI